MMLKYISDRIAVLYRGRIVEMGPAQAVYEHPLHAYTKSLISAIPLPDPESERTRRRIPFVLDDHALQGVLQEAKTETGKQSKYNLSIDLIDYICYHASIRHGKEERAVTRRNGRQFMCFCPLCVFAALSL